MSVFVDGIADYLVSGGVGQYFTSGLAVSATTIQVDFRRDPGAAQVVLVRQAGGAGYPFAYKELQAFQVLVDGGTLSGTKAKSRQVYDTLHERTMLQVSGGYHIMWMRATTLPQSIPTISTLPNDKERFLFSINFQALLVLSGTS